MASDIKKRFSSFLPGGGFDSAGNPKQGKTRVVGLIDVTSYAGGGGESLSAIDVGLSTIDSIKLRPVNEVPGGDGKHKREAVYASDSNTFYLLNVDAAGSRTHEAAAAAIEVEFVVEGDSAHDVELT